MALKIGERFGLLTVIDFDEDYIQPSGRVRKMYKCQCDCGVIKSYREDGLKKLTSCGCRRDKDNAIRMTKHSESRTRLYKLYYSMRHRCLVPTSSEYSRYGGRGICVCQEWLDSYENFAKWARDNGYKDNDYTLSLERIDVNGNYCPSNCKFIPIKDQYNNMRKTIRIGDLSLSEFCRRAGLDYNEVHNKYYRSKDIVYALGFKKENK